MNKNKFNVLIVDDEEKTRNILEINLRERFNIFTAKDGEKAIDVLKDSSVHLVLSDWKMPNKDGRILLKEIQKDFPDVPVIIMTAYGNIQNAVEMMKEGAFDFIEKPIKLNDLEVVLDRAEKVIAVIEENRKLKQELYRHNIEDTIIATDEKMRSLLKSVKDIATTDLTVLVQGETGTGKEMIAKAIHNYSNRADKIFVALNCGAIPRELIESELFGSEKGAFTGSVSTRIGKFELANEGTLFLDEIGELPSDMQVKLLRVLEERVITKLGSNQQIKVDVRIIAATNRNLSKQIEENKFRSDLYYRLNVINFNIPPLRERKEDISLLAMHFINKKNSSLNKCIEGFDKGFMEYLKSYHWPGNVRELENVILRSMVSAKSKLLQVEDIPGEVKLMLGDNENSVPSDYQEFLKVKQMFKEKYINELETKFLLEGLRKNEWNISRTARYFNMDRRQLQNMIKDNNLKAPDNND
ncbi:MAG: sigma-54-dependent Fis family transcriptional regulator [Ignavibacteriae bacterium]|nr:sigma-54-dependent Fis family transcriptional regulator [Ignavibacteriota bacterium]